MSVTDQLDRQRQIVKAIEELGGTATTVQIADRIDVSVRSVSTSLTWMRGAGMVVGRGGCGWSVRD